MPSKKGSVYDGGVREPTLMWWPRKIPAGSVCSEVAASIDIMPTLVALCGGDLPERKIDGKERSQGCEEPARRVCSNARAWHRSLWKWKFYPWQEGKGNQNRNNAKWTPSPDPVQLYDTVADIGETTNVASMHPEIANRLKAAYDAHVAEIEANQRPTAEMVRRADAVSPERPEAAKNQPAKQRPAMKQPAKKRNKQ